jgi:Lon protease-like protein
MKIQDLPPIVPVLPLDSPLLLPGTVVPFYASESRYLSLVEDVMASDGYVGILQPMKEGTEAGDSTLYTVGCLGRIGECQEDDPGLLVLAAGIIRFRVLQELPGDRGYRLALVDYSEFLDDVDEIEEELEFSTLREMIRQRLETNRAEFDLSIMDGMAGTEIITAIAHAIALSPAERQMLMETSRLRELEEVLLLLMTGVGGVPSFDVSSSLPS